MRLTWLHDVLKAAGVKVTPVVGWETRGSPVVDPRVIIDHHTASRPGSNAPSLNICVNGRGSIPGPLCNLLIARDSRVYLIAAGRSNNAGRGGWAPYNARNNSHTIGVEVEHAGDLSIEPINNDQLDTAAVVDAAICLKLGWEADRCVGHREWSPGGRKIDPVWSMQTHREKVGTLLVEARNEDDAMQLPSTIEAAVQAVRTTYERGPGPKRGPGIPADRDGFNYWADMAETAARTDFENDDPTGSAVEDVRSRLTAALAQET